MLMRRGDQSGAGASCVRRFSEVPMRRIGLAVVLALGLAFASVDVAAQSPTVAGAKQVGWLGLVPLPRLMAEFERGMRELGYVEGTSYALVALYEGDRPETLQSLAAELVRRKPDVIVGEAFCRRPGAPANDQDDTRCLHHGRSGDNRVGSKPSSPGR